MVHSHSWQPERKPLTMTENGPLVSIVIPSYNGKALLKNCLRSLRKQTYRPIEILVVDNGSSDGTAELLDQEFPEVKIVAQKNNLGFAAGCNRGAHDAKGQWILFLNNDTTHAPDFIGCLVESALQKEEIGIAYSKVLLQSPEGTIDSIGSQMTALGFLTHIGLYEEDRGQYDQIKEVFSPKGVSFLVRRSLFERLGGFDEQFFAYFEESDFSWRVWLSGHQVVFVPKSQVIHVSTATASRLDPAVIHFHTYKNRIRSLLKNLGTLRAFWVIPIHLLVCATIAAIHLIRGRWSASGAIVRSVLWNLRHLYGTLRARQNVQQKIREVSDRQIFRSLQSRTSWKSFWRLYRLYVAFWEEKCAPLQPRVHG